MNLQWRSAGQRAGSTRHPRVHRRSSVGGWIDRLEDRRLLALTPIAASVNFTAGVVSPTTAVGYFLDDDPNAATTDFNVSIDWGSSSPKSAGIVALIPAPMGAPTSPKLFSISGINRFPAPGIDPITISVAGSKPGDTTTINSSAFVGAAVLPPIPTPALAPFSTSVSLTAGVPQGNPVTVGSFFDASSSATASDF